MKEWPILFFYRELIRLIGHTPDNPVWMKRVPWKRRGRSFLMILSLTILSWGLFACITWMYYIAGQGFGPSAGPVGLLLPDVTLFYFYDNFDSYQAVLIAIASLLAAAAVPAFVWMPEKEGQLEELQTTQLPKRDISFGAIAGSGMLLPLVLLPFVAYALAGLILIPSNTEVLQEQLRRSWYYRRPDHLAFFAAYGALLDDLLLFPLWTWVTAISLWLRNPRGRWTAVLLAPIIALLYYATAVGIAHIGYFGIGSDWNLDYGDFPPDHFVVPAALVKWAVMIPMTLLYIYLCCRFAGLEYFRTIDPEAVREVYWRGDEVVTWRKNKARREALKAFRKRVAQRVRSGVPLAIGAAVTFAAAPLMVMFTRIWSIATEGRVDTGESFFSEVLATATNSFSAMLILFIALWVMITRHAEAMEAEGGTVVRGALFPSLFRWTMPIALPVLAGALTMDLIPIGLGYSDVLISASRSYDATSMAVTAMIIVFLLAKVVTLTMVGMVACALMLPRSRRKGWGLTIVFLALVTLLAVSVFSPLHTWLGRYQAMTEWRADLSGRLDNYAVILVWGVILFGLPQAIQRIYEEMVLPKRLAEGHHVPEAAPVPAPAEVAAEHEPAAG